MLGQGREPPRPLPGFAAAEGVFPPDRLVSIQHPAGRQDRVERGQIGVAGRPPHQFAPQLHGGEAQGVLAGRPESAAPEVAPVEPGKEGGGHPVEGIRLPPEPDALHRGAHDPAALPGDGLDPRPPRVVMEQVGVDVAGGASPTARGGSPAADGCLLGDGAMHKSLSA